MFKQVIILKPGTDCKILYFKNAGQIMKNASRWHFKITESKRMHY